MSIGDIFRGNNEISLFVLPRIYFLLIVWEFWTCIYTYNTFLSHTSPIYCPIPFRPPSSLCPLLTHVFCFFFFFLQWPMESNQCCPCAYEYEWFLKGNIFLKSLIFILVITLWKDKLHKRPKTLLTCFLALLGSFSLLPTIMLL